MSQASGTTDDPELREKMTGVTTATATHLLILRGYRNQFMLGANPLQAGVRVCGRAVTVRFGPGRPDLEFTPDTRNENEHLRLAIESVRPGDFMVLDCGGDTRGGTVGDILTARIKRLGGVGVLVDGSIRDGGQIRELVGLPAWSRGIHGSGYPAFLVGLDHQRPVRAFGVTVVPGDYILADDDGAVAIPAALAAEIAEAGLETERKETFIRGLVEQGVSINECYPPNEETLRRYEAWKRQTS
jgi:regulator of RNase E activity RraA